MAKLLERVKCFCGCDSFYICKKGKHWVVICQSCRCQRVINTPGIAVDNYEIGPSFMTEEKNEER
jgi:hypothetical protein